jgi:hypothetical protein
MLPITQTNLLFQIADEAPRLALADQSGTFSLSKSIKYFNPLPWRPQNLGVRVPVKKAYCGNVV